MVRGSEVENYFKDRIGDVFLLFQCGVYHFPGEELFHLDFARKNIIYEGEKIEG